MNEPMNGPSSAWWESHANYANTMRATSSSRGPSTWVSHHVGVWLPVSEDNTHTHTKDPDVEEHKHSLFFSLTIKCTNIVKMLKCILTCEIRNTSLFLVDSADKKVWKERDRTSSMSTASTRRWSINTIMCGRPNGSREVLESKDESLVEFDHGGRV